MVFVPSALPLRTDHYDLEPDGHVQAHNDNAYYINSLQTQVTAISGSSGSGGGAVSSVAGKTGAVSLVKADVGLANVDNTSDANKPVSNAVAAALASLTKASVGLSNVDNTSDASKPVSTAQQTALDLKAPKDSPTFTGTVSGVTKAHVGLGNVDNTSDVNKPVSVAQAAAMATVAINAQTGTTYTLVLTDAGACVELSNAAAITATIPPNSTAAFPIGTVLELFQAGAGQVTVAAGAGVTLRAPDGARLAKQYASASLRKRATDEWVLSGSTIV